MTEATNTITATDFRKNFSRYLSEAREGGGPIALTQNAEVVGVFLSVEAFDALYHAAIKKLLAARAHGPTIAHEEAARRIRKNVKRLRERS